MRTRVIPIIGLVLLYSTGSKSQCGLDPTTGTVTINTALQIVNSYYPGQGNPNMGGLSLRVGTLDGRGSASPLATGDLVLIIQMQGVDINSTNSNSYGDGVNTGPASGYLNSNIFASFYEYNSVASVAGSTVTFAYSLANNYYTQSFVASTNAIRTYQVIRIPRYFNLTITAPGSVTCPAWNGSTGGVIAIDAANTFTINGGITANALGFRGGGGINLNGATVGNTNGSGTLTNTDYRWNSPATTAANLTGGVKGEGIAGTPIYVLNNGSTTITTNSVEGYLDGAMGRGAPGNAGGGGTDGSPIGTNENQYNPGGGGGGNAGAGGQGGSGWHGGSGSVSTYPTGGNGGSAFAQRSIQRLIMGGGGGAGTANNSTAVNQYMSSGGAGGGIILLRAKLYASTGATISANGADAIGVTGGGTNTDAAGGGGAGGTIVAVTRQTGAVGLTNVIATATGGKGGNMDTYFDHGPGGGGGGGMIMTNGTFASTNVTGGANGLTRTGSAAGPITNAYGATAGGNGQLLSLAYAPILKNVNNAASPCGTLPITLVSFRATLSGSAVLLNWETSDAVNFSDFEIEYSSDGASFTTVGQVAYITQQSSYQYTHSPVTAPANYYRLKMVDINGSFKYSKTLLVRTASLSADLAVYPQPARDHIIINLSVQRTQPVRLQLYNATGSKVKETRIQLNKGNNSFTIDNLELLPPGIYMLRTSIDDHLVGSKVVIGKN